MKQYLHLLTALTVLTLTGCLADETTSPSAEPISFRAMASTTRGQAVEGTGADGLFPSDKSFSVFAYEEGLSQPFIDGERVVCIGTNHWVTPNNHYWPADSRVDFFALYPADTQFNRADRRVADYSVSTVLADQMDLMYAATIAQTKAINSQDGVALNFKHALARVSFSYEMVTPGVEAQVESVTIYNVRGTDTFQFPSATNRSGYWLENGTNWANYTYVIGGDELMLLPQQLPAWQPENGVTISGARLNRQVYLAVKCRLSAYGFYYVGSPTTYGLCYVPLGGSWDPGNSYHYTLQFGGGYDEQGSPILEPMAITTRIADWADGGVRHFQGNMEGQQSDSRAASGND